MSREAVYPVVHHREKMLEIAFTHTSRLSEDHYSFVNAKHL
jgi:hypothetical protein